MIRSFTLVINNLTACAEQPEGTVTLDYLRHERRLTGTKEGCREGDCGACAVLLGEAVGQGMLYRTVNSCLLPLGAVEGRHLVTIEGLNPGDGYHQNPAGDTAAPYDSDTALIEEPAPDAGAHGSTLPRLSPVQACFLEEGASQCGFCTPGFVVSLTGYLLRSPQPTLAGALDAVAGNICRCTGYASIRRAIARLLEALAGQVPPVEGAQPRRSGGSLSSASGPGVARQPGSSGVVEPDRLGRLVELGIVPRYFLGIPRRLQSLAEAAAEEVRAADGTEHGTEHGTDDREPGTGALPQAADRVLVAGGTDLFVQRPEELERGALRFLSREQGLSGLWRDNGLIVVGAATTMEELRALPELAATLDPAADALQWVASSPIRQRASVGGNLVNASPIGDLTVLLLALGARLGLRSSTGTREVPLEGFYRGYKQLDLASGEIVAWIAFAPPAVDGFLGFEKVGRRKHLDIASVNSAACLRVGGEGRRRSGSRRILEARLAAGGVAPVPLFLARTSADLVGKAVTPAAFRQALDTVQEEISPISDVRGSAAYKRLALRQLLIAHFLGAFPEELGGEDWR